MTHKSKTDWKAQCWRWSNKDWELKQERGCGINVLSILLYSRVYIRYFNIPYFEGECSW